MAFAAEHFRLLARYNAWANGQLFAACASLPEAEYRKPRPSFFKSLHGTLNHILVGDRIWFGRIEGRDAGIRALDQQLYGDFVGLRVARQAEDARIIACIDSLEEADFQRMVHYRNLTGQAQAETLGRLLAHVFNHQTHHRGQAHDQLSQTPVAPPPLDLIYYMREVG